MRFAPEALAALAGLRLAGQRARAAERDRARRRGGPGDVVRAADLPLRVDAGPGRGRRPGSLAEAERAHVRRGARGPGWNITPRGPRPRRGPRHALQQDPQVRAEEAGDAGLRPAVPSGGAASRRRSSWCRSPTPAAGTLESLAARLSRRVAVACHVGPRLAPAARGASPTATSSTRTRCSRRVEARATGRPRLLVGVAGGGHRDPDLHASSSASPARAAAPASSRSRARTRRSTACRADPGPAATSGWWRRSVHELGHLATPRALPRPRLPDELRRQHRAGRRPGTAVLPLLRRSAPRVAQGKRAASGPGVRRRKGDRVLRGRLFARWARCVRPEAVSVQIHRFETDPAGCTDTPAGRGNRSHSPALTT